MQIFLLCIIVAILLCALFFERTKNLQTPGKRKLRWKLGLLLVALLSPTIPIKLDVDTKTV